MGEVLYSFLSDFHIAYMNTIVGVILAVILLYLFFCKSSRDERGRKIIGKASIISFICFMILTTFISHFIQAFSAGTSPEMTVNAVMVVHAIQVVFNTVILVEIVSILILRKME